MVSSVLTKEQQAVVQPEENLMFDREGFQREDLRLEFAQQVAIDSGTKWVEQDQTMYIHPNSGLPDGPTTEGESFGNIELIREVGGTTQIPRYTYGFTVDTEDTEVSTEWLSDARDAIMRLFDLQADLKFFNGLDARDGSQVHKGVFEWLEDNMDANNIIDCSNYNPSSGDLGSIPANIVMQVAYGKVTGNYVTNQWDLAVAKHPVWSEWNTLGTFDGAGVESQWEMMQADMNSASVGVSRRVLLPKELTMPAPADVAGQIGGSLDFPTRTNSAYDSPIGDLEGYTDDDDVMYLIPRHDGDFYELYEQGTPDVRGPIMKEGFRERWEYKWRGGVVQGQSFRAQNRDLDVIKLENVTALFDNA